MQLLVAVIFGFLTGGGMTRAQTVLNLSATGSDMTAQNEMVAALTVQTQTPNAAAFNPMRVFICPELPTLALPRRRQCLHGC